jgi:hypothetical protein
VEVTKKKNEADNAYIKMNDLKGKKKTIPIFSLLLLYIRPPTNISGQKTTTITTWPYTPLQTFY